jgi:erythromycin esterase-like protein
VEAHEFRAIALESSFPRGRSANEYVLGQGQGGAAAIEEVLESGFSHGFGRMAANRELVEWMRAYNANAADAEKVHFYGFDSPTEMMYADSPRQMLEFVLDYLAAVDVESTRAHRERISGLIGDDAAWENQAAAMEPTKSFGLSPAATSLRIAVEDLVTELWVRRPEFMTAAGADRYAEAAHYASAARQLLVYHAAMAGTSEKRLVECLGIRDAMMAENLTYIVSRERSRPSTGSGQGSRVLAFAHNMHLQCGKAAWLWGPNLHTWWPAGSHLRRMMGSRYAVIGVSTAESEEIGLARAEARSLEGMLSGGPGAASLAPTHLGVGLPADQVATLSTRSASTKMAYFPFSSQGVTDFDWLAVLD